ncbi:MAG: [FeFe] hydrogenase H-cluster radical SAM maturase HydG [Limnochordia bacterium]|jgi:2-iminoacetate synthase
MPTDRREWESADFIDEAQIRDELSRARQADSAEVARILQKAEQAEGLTPYEAAVLLQTADKEQIEMIYAVARQVKERIYGRRIVIFAPLYISNHCVNGCRYCGYSCRQALARRRLTRDELIEEVRLLEAMGHKRLALEAGEDPVNCPIDYVLECIETIYATSGGPEGNRHLSDSIRRINVNVAATTIEEYRRLKEAGIGTYILFQETYHRESYDHWHPVGPKSDYDWHTTAMDRAMRAGIDDVGVGVLLGLYDYRFDVLGVLHHAAHLEERFGVGPHTVSVPRLRPAAGLDMGQFRHLLSDDDFRRVVAVIRLALPYTGIILSTRERPGFRDDVIGLGVSQISAGSSTGVGGYRRELEHSQEDRPLEIPQFAVDDHRRPHEIIRMLCAAGYVPSYCTACYRQGRTGDRFMQLAKTGQIQNVCQPNALLTLKEYALDYADPETKQEIERAIDREMATIPNEKVRAEVRGRLTSLEQGERDLFF